MENKTIISVIIIIVGIASLVWWSKSVDNKKLSDAEEIFRDIIVSDPENELAYFWLGQSYLDEERPGEAITAFERAIGINPELGKAHVRLGRCYTNEGRFDEAERAFRRAVELKQEITAYIDLAVFYGSQRRLGDACSVLEKVLALHPPYYVYLLTEQFYRSHGKKDEADKVLKDAMTAVENGIKDDPSNDKLHKLLVRLYEEFEEHALAEAHRAKYEFSKPESYNSVTRYNYRRLKRIVLDRGIKLVCVQYPMRSIAPLKKMLEPNDGAVFVDNEAVFKEALKDSSYDEYFEDRFGGDFGHCTPEGNRLLAGNIADTVIRECFNK